MFKPTEPAPPAPRPFIESGFLTDYSGLQPVSAGSLRHVYRKADANFAAYQNLIFKKMTLWRDGDDQAEVANEDFQRIANGLYAVIHKRLSRELAMTDQVGPNTLKLRSALVAIDDVNDQLDVYVTDAESIPADTDEALPPGLREFGRKAWIEAELVDATTGEVLLAVVDRAGNVIPGASEVENWIDLHRAFVAWSELIATRLAELRGQ